MIAGREGVTVDIRDRIPRASDASIPTRSRSRINVVVLGIEEGSEK